MRKVDTPESGDAYPQDGSTEGAVGPAEGAQKKRRRRRWFSRWGYVYMDEVQAELDFARRIIALGSNLHYTVLTPRRREKMKRNDSRSTTCSSTCRTDEKSSGRQYTAKDFVEAKKYRREIEELFDKAVQAVARGR